MSSDSSDQPAKLCDLIIVFAVVTKHEESHWSGDFLRCMDPVL